MPKAVLLWWILANFGVLYDIFCVSVTWKDMERLHGLSLFYKPLTEIYEPCN